MLSVKITDPKSEFFGKTLTLEMIYHDHKHTGDSPDLIYTKDDKGTTHTFLSTSIDEDDLKQQQIKKISEELGAQEGDKVLILSPRGSNHYPVNFDFSIPHTITRISPSENVDFDNGAASFFRPNVQKIKEA